MWGVTRVSYARNLSRFFIGRTFLRPFTHSRKTQEGYSFHKLTDKPLWGRRQKKIRSVRSGSRPRGRSFFCAAPTKHAGLTRVKTACVVNRPSPKDESEAHRFHGVTNGPLFGAGVKKRPPHGLERPLFARSGVGTHRFRTRRSGTKLFTGNSGIQ